MVFGMEGYIGADAIQSPKGVKRGRGAVCVSTRKRSRQ